MPPEPTLARSSNCRSNIGIIIAWPHFLHGSEPSGGRSPGINVLASQPGQVTIFNGRFPSLMMDSIYHSLGRFKKKFLAHHFYIQSSFRIIKSERIKPLTNKVKTCFISIVEMKNTFTTMIEMHPPVNGWMAIGCGYSRREKNVGVKF